MESKKEKKVSVVVDTNFLLKQINLRDLLPQMDGDKSFEETYNIITLYEVMKEVRDE